MNFSFEVGRRVVDQDFVCHPYSSENLGVAEAGVGEP